MKKKVLHIPASIYTDLSDDIIKSVFLAYTANLAKRLNIELPLDYFSYAPLLCWSCHRETIVFAWPGSDSFDSSVDPDRPFCPSVIDSPSGSQNVCFHCGRVQGHFYLHLEPDGPFFSLYPSGDQSVDILEIARYAEYSKFAPFDRVFIDFSRFAHD